MNLQFASSELVPIYSYFDSIFYCGQVERHILIFMLLIFKKVTFPIFGA